VRKDFSPAEVRGVAVGGSSTFGGSMPEKVKVYADGRQIARGDPTYSEDSSLGGPPENVEGLVSSQFGPHSELRSDANPGSRSQLCSVSGGGEPLARGLLSPRRIALTDVPRWAVANCLWQETIPRVDDEETAAPSQRVRLLQRALGGGWNNH